MSKWLIDDRIIYEIVAIVRADCKNETQTNPLKQERKPLKPRIVEIIKRYNIENKDFLDEPVPLGAVIDIFIEVKRQQEERLRKLRRNETLGKIVQKRYWRSYAKARKKARD
jgi:hypothetical protein